MVTKSVKAPTKADQLLTAIKAAQAELKGPRKFSLERLERAIDAALILAMAMKKEKPN
jgi:hypothetical protein